MSQRATEVRTGSVWLHFLEMDYAEPSHRKACIMSHKQQYEASDLDYGTENFRSSERIDSSKRKAPQMGRRRGKTPQSFNGIHRRRRRKLAW